MQPLPRTETTSHLIHTVDCRSALSIPQDRRALLSLAIDSYHLLAIAAVQTAEPMHMYEQGAILDYRGAISRHAQAIVPM